MKRTHEVSHNLHNQETKWLDPDRKADASGGCFGFHFNLRRRRTSDGFTRFEGTILAPVMAIDGGMIFTVYLTDDERRRMAAALLEGLD
jgi:hypothetical protein